MVHAIQKTANKLWILNNIQLNANIYILFLLSKYQLSCTVADISELRTKNSTMLIGVDKLNLVYISISLNYIVLWIILFVWERMTLLQRLLHRAWSKLDSCPPPTFSVILSLRGGLLLACCFARGRLCSFNSACWLIPICREKGKC